MYFLFFAVHFVQLLLVFFWGIYLAMPPAIFLIILFNCSLSLNTFFSFLSYSSLSMTLKFCLILILIFYKLLNWQVTSKAKAEKFSTCKDFWAIPIKVLIHWAQRKVTMNLTRRTLIEMNIWHPEKLKTNLSPDSSCFEPKWNIFLLLF